MTFISLFFLQFLEKAITVTERRIIDLVWTNSLRIAIMESSMKGKGKLVLGSPTTAPVTESPIEEEYFVEKVMDRRFSRFLLQLL